MVGGETAGEPPTLKRFRYRRTTAPLAQLFILPVANIDKVAGDGGGGGHGGRNQVGAAPLALPAFEVAIAGRGTALARRELVGIHGQAHAAAGLAPFEAGLAKDPVKPFALGLSFHLAAAGHDHRADALGYVVAATTAAAARRSSIRALVHEPMNTRSS